MEKIINFLLKNQNKFLYLFVFLFTAFLTLPSLISDKHILYNLEPYPDGLYYTLSAKNFIQTGKLVLEYNNIITAISQPPLYSVFLIFGYLFWNNPASFYLINTILLIISIFFLEKIILKHTDSLVLKITTTTLLISHGYLFWLISVPMTENLALLLFILSLYTLTKEKIQKKAFILVTMLAMLLVLTRISLIPTALIFFGINFYLYSKNIHPKTKTYYLILSLIALIVINYFFSIFIGQSLLGYASYFFKTAFSNSVENVFYNSNNIAKNILHYFKVFLGFNSNFLWLAYPLTSFAPIAIILTNLIYNKNYSKQKILIITSTFLSLFLLLLSFYTADSRYVIYSIPLFIFLIVLTTPKKPHTTYILTILVLLIFHIINQLPIFKQILSENVLHRSVAWQYEAVKTINEFAAKEHNPYIITALPPHLIQAYAKNQITIYPLSTHQEFLQKKQYVWGNSIDYTNLIEFYEKKLVSNQKIFITNSYITHQKSVIDDFEVYKNTFELQLVQEGCFQSCNIYQLQLIP